MLLAHQGGWDESLFVLGPLALLFGLLRMARRRAEQEQAQEQVDDMTEQPPPE